MVLTQPLSEQSGSIINFSALYKLFERGKNLGLIYWFHVFSSRFCQGYSLLGRELRKLWKTSPLGWLGLKDPSRKEEGSEALANFAELP
jgi:hypothetical protein